MFLVVGISALKPLDSARQMGTFIYGVVEHVVSRDNPKNANGNQQCHTKQHSRPLPQRCRSQMSNAWLWIGGCDRAHEFRPRLRETLQGTSRDWSWIDHRH